MNRKFFVQVIALLFILFGINTVATAAVASPFVIRENPTIQTNNTHVTGAIEFVIKASGEKAGWGSDDLNGFTIGQIDSLSITRYDDTARYTSGSGPAVAPYFNIWVTDGSGHFAVIANEPSNAAFQYLFVTNPDGSKSYNLSFADLLDKTAKVYETPGWDTGTSWVHDLFGTALTFEDIATLVILAPDADYITNPVNGVGSGAPDDLYTNYAYGFNWVFGDTLSNYVSGVDEGYVVANMGVSAVPIPAAAWLLGSGLLGLAGIRRKKR